MGFVGDGTVQLRCLACGVSFVSSDVAAPPDRCAVCLAANRRIDLVMRWIWRDSNPPRPPATAESAGSA